MATEISPSKGIPARYDGGGIVKFPPVKAQPNHIGNPVGPVPKQSPKLPEPGDGTSFLSPREQAVADATALLTANTAGLACPPVQLRPKPTLAEQLNMAHDPVVRLGTEPVNPKQQRAALMRRATEAGLISGEAFRRKMGLSFSAFKGAIRDGLIPPPLCERGGTSFWLKEITDEAAFRLGR